MKVSEAVSQKSDLFRIQKAKEAIGIAPNTIRNFANEGLPVYKVGKMVFVSIADVELFIKRRATRQQPFKGMRARKPLLKEAA